MYKKLFAILISIIFICCGCGMKNSKQQYKSLSDTITERDQIIIGVKSDSYPFGYKTSSGNYEGYDVEIGRIIAKNLLGDRNKVKFVPVTASDRMMKLYSNDVDILIATMSITPKRKEILDFSNSYYTAGQAILVKKGSKIRHLKDLSGKRVIIVFGSTSEQSLRSGVSNLGILGYKTYDDAYKALKNGRAEALVSDNAILLNYALKDDSVELLPQLYTKEPYAIAFRKEKESQSMIKYVNEILNKEARKGTLDKLQEQFEIK